MSALVVSPTELEIEDAIQAWAAAWSGVPVIWAEQPGPKPAEPYLTLKIIARVPLGSSTPGPVEEGEEVDFEQSLIRYEDYTISIQGRGEGANQAMTALKMSVDVDAARETLKTTKLVLVNDPAINDISSLEESIRKSRWQMDQVIRVVLEARADISTSGGYIQAVRFGEIKTIEGNSELKEGPIIIGTPAES